ncbi:DUF222 domain-containing protein [Gordonia zhaorongruii]|uniref:DUF222 domain-containing protein n=1 Tax=Gordonia zhaorongruii TaxID=2597659 RepID=UPI0010488BA0|nr:DUF222 domain-containing protein [Gordonia zhaorongruii]
MTSIDTAHRSPVHLPDSALDLARLIDAATTKLAQARLDPMTDDEVITTVTTLERAHRRSDGVDARMFIEVSDREAFRTVGCTSAWQFLDCHLRLGAGPGKRHRLAAAAIGRLRSMHGELLDPALPATAAAVADGHIGIDHLLRITDTMKQIPAAVPDAVRADAEAQLAEAATTLSPRSTTIVGNRLLEHLNPDGAPADDRDRRRNRSLTLGGQDRLLMSRIFGSLDPQARAAFDAFLQHWAAPGMNNPDDPQSPRGPANRSGLDPAALAAAAERDTRTTDQRGHDAFRALCETHIADGSLGHPTSLPAHLVITADITDLEQRSGIALTATGTRIPITDLVDLAAHATPWLEIFDNHTSNILYLGRGKRLATMAQRLALFGRDRGSTAPDCNQPFTRTQAHHMPDWQHGGPTDIDHLGAACGPHNRTVTTRPGGWETTLITHGPHQGRIGWRPTNTNQPWQINHTHHPEILLRQEDSNDERPARVHATRHQQSPIERWLACRIPAKRILDPPIQVAVEPQAPQD